MRGDVMGLWENAGRLTCVQRFDPEFCVQVQLCLTHQYNKNVIFTTNMIGTTIIHFKSSYEYCFYYENLNIIITIDWY